MKKFTLSATSIALGLILILSFSAADAATKTWSGTASTDWSVGGAGGNWGGAAVPTGSDVINIPGSLTNYPVVSTTVSGLSGAITINSSGSGATLTITTGGSFTTTGLITVAATGTFTMLNGTATLAGITSSGSIDVQGGTITSTVAITMSSGTITQSGGTVWMATNTATDPTDALVITSGTVTQSGGTFYTKDFKPAAGTFNQTGTSAVFRIFHDWGPTAAGTHVFTSTSGTVRFSSTGGVGGGNVFTNTSTQFNNILVDAGAVTDFGNTAGGIVNLSGDYTDNNTGALTITTAYTVTFNGSGAQTITTSRGTNNSFSNLTISNTGGTVSVQII